MTLPLPPILRLLTPDERPDPPRALVTFTDPTEAQRMAELERALGAPPVVPFFSDDIIVDDPVESTCTPGDVEAVYRRLLDLRLKAPPNVYGKES